MKMREQSRPIRVSSKSELPASPTAEAEATERPDRVVDP